MKTYDAARLQKVLKKFSGLKVAVVGDVMLDAYLWGSVDRISPEAPVPVVSVEKKEIRPGGAANVALNLRELGAIPLLFSVVGFDEAGKELTTLLRKRNIGAKGILKASGRITTVKTRILSRQHQLLRYDSEVIHDLSERESRQFFELLRNSLKKEKPVALIFEDYNKGCLPASLISSIMELCREQRIFTAVDPKSKNFFAYKQCDLFKPNLREVREALGISVDPANLTSLMAARQKMKKQLGHHITVITLSDQGMFYSDSRFSGTLPGHKMDIADVSGAGDTVIAVLCCALATGTPLREAAAIANLAGGLVCEYAGVVPVTSHMLLQSAERLQGIV